MDYSIIICTYNTDERILRRCLNSVQNLDKEGIEIEVIIADNNSTIPVESLDFVRSVKKSIPNLYILSVIRQGVKYARMAAIEKATGKFIVYIDADNEPSPDYLQKLKQLNIQFTKVGAWGPGKVSVEFIDGIHKSIETVARKAFQDRHESSVQISNKSEWQPCYPFGTGLCMHSSVLKEYLELAKKGILSSLGRSGKELTSGEDTQMVMLCIKKGYYAGVSPELHLNHLIPKSRANVPYLKKLAFGTALSYEPSMIQLFPERKNSLSKTLLTPVAFSRKAIKKVLMSQFTSLENKLDIIHFIGYHAGVYESLNKKLPGTVKKLITLLRVK